MATYSAYGSPPLRLPTRRPTGGGRHARTRRGIHATGSATVVGAAVAFVAVAAGVLPAPGATQQLTLPAPTTAPLPDLAPPAPDAGPTTPASTAPPVGTNLVVAKKAVQALHRADARQIAAAAVTHPATATLAGHRGPVPAVSASGRGGDAARAALSRLGKPYVFGAAGPSAFDCSGLVVWAFAQAGVTLPHSAATLATMGSTVSRDALQPGDLLFYYSPVSHVAMYIGNGQVVEASNESEPVSVSKVYYADFVTARRL